MSQDDIGSLSRDLATCPLTAEYSGEGALCDSSEVRYETRDTVRELSRKVAEPARFVQHLCIQHGN